MQTAFYAPLKPPDHPEPSGDRTVARLLLKALRRAGADPVVASRFRARAGTPDEAAQKRLAARGRGIADRLLARYGRLPKRERPQAWFTYHLYYKAVDWVGPHVARTLGIPYLVAEASHAPKRATGAYAFSHRAAEAAIGLADAIFCLNPADRECLEGIVPKEKLVDLPPFLDMAAFAGNPDAAPPRDLRRRDLAARHGPDPGLPWLLAVAMMRPGDKLASYRVLSEALRLVETPCQMLIVGDGPARPEVERAFAAARTPVFWLGLQPERGLPAIYAAADLLVWPAINEAFGMALLEAQSCGCPVVAGAAGGVPGIIADRETGWLSPPGNVAALAADIDFALGHDLGAVRRAARSHAFGRHDIGAAAAKLRATLERLGVR